MCRVDAPWGVRVAESRIAHVNVLKQNRKFRRLPELGKALVLAVLGVLARCEQPLVFAQEKGGFRRAAWRCRRQA